MTNSLYKPLTGKRRAIASFSQLWMGPDHILLVRSSRVTERYQRFAFADIQSIVITSTPDRTVLQILAVITAIAWGALAMATDSRFASGFFLVTGVLAVVLAAIDIARGPVALALSTLPSARSRCRVSRASASRPNSSPHSAPPSRPSKEQFLPSARSRFRFPRPTSKSPRRAS